jgi:branched-subunit amino acid transport protein AzlD
MLKRYVVVPVGLVALIAAVAWVSDSLPPVTSPPETLVWFTAAWLLWVGPVTFISLGLATRAAARRRSAALSRPARFLPSLTPRGLAALALWLALALTGYFFAVAATLAHWLPVNIDSPGPPWGASAVAVVLPADIMAVILVFCFAAVLRAVLTRPDDEHGLIGRELVAAYVVTLLGSIPPAALAYVGFAFRNGWF